MSIVYAHNNDDLSERERMILQMIVQTFIRQASPVGSRSLAKALEKELKLSAATIRNVVADLEEFGYVTHPHTSAGRMPTDKGYRFYVDALMRQERVTPAEQTQLESLANSPKEHLLRDASKILGALSHHMAIVRLPKFEDVLVKRIDLISLSTDKVLAVLSLDSDIIQTITIESDTVVTSGSIEDVSRYLNERLSGRPLNRINDIFSDVGLTTVDASASLVRLFVEQVGRLNSTDSASNVVHVSGAQQLLSQPEFDDPARMRSVIELMENEDMIIHVVDTAQSTDGINVRIGNELNNAEMEDYSLITTTYRVGNARGSVSLIGPKRMEYSRMMSLVQLVSDTLNTNLR